MFHICFAADENYIKYNAVLITSIIKSVDKAYKFEDFFDDKNALNLANKQESKPHEDLKTNSSLKSTLNSTNSNLNSTNLAKNLGEKFDENSTQNSNPNAQIKHENPAFSSLANYKKLAYKNLSEDEKSEGFVFHILSDFVSEISRQKLKNLAQNLSEIYPCEIEIHICEDAIFQGLLRLGGNYLTYFRFFIPNLLPKSVKIALYLDVDMLCVGDLRALFALDLKDNALGVIKDRIIEAMNAHKVHKTGLEKLYDGFYFNAGFLLINLTKWQEGVQKCLDFLATHKVIMHDQDALNAVYGRDCLVLPPNFNLLCKPLQKDNFTQDYSINELEFATLHPVIYHFSYIHKTWHYFTGLKCFQIWWDLALQTPIFKDELVQISNQNAEKIVQNYLEFLPFKDEIRARKIFDKYLGSVILQHSQSFKGYLKMPFVVKDIFKAKNRGKLNAEKMREFLSEFERNFSLNLAKNDGDLSENSMQNLSKNPQISATNYNENLLLECARIATRAYNRRKKLRLIFLPLKIYKSKKKFAKNFA